MPEECRLFFFFDLDMLTIPLLSLWQISMVGANKHADRLILAKRRKRFINEKDEVYQQERYFTVGI